VAASGWLRSVRLGRRRTAAAGTGHSEGWRVEDRCALKSRRSSAAGPDLLWHRPGWHWAKFSLAPPGLAKACRQAPGPTVYTLRHAPADYATLSLMTTPDLSNLSYSELSKLSEELNQQIQAQRVEELKVLADGYIKTTQATVFSLQEAIDALRPSRSKKCASVPTKAIYRDPSNPANTWSGRGLPAKCLTAYVAQDRSRTEFKDR
jgi:DNA-binding protein H-NS